ncbi:hypothetical protein [Foetidibacter luteolus]|uniref:hypothetical protein n=1 Tax=Foetidibacter luteolus TaxID=2608880 RepID=UPI00129B3FB4|nr:hypothetical protein [Foetidibacter luteolus]
MKREIPILLQFHDLLIHGTAYARNDHTSNEPPSKFAVTVEGFFDSEIEYVQGLWVCSNIDVPELVQCIGEYLRREWKKLPQVAE